MKALYSKLVFFIYNSKKLSVNRKDIQALSLLEPNRQNPVPDPLDVLHLDNRLYIHKRDFGGSNIIKNTTFVQKIINKD